MDTTMTTDRAALDMAFLLGGHAFFTVANGRGDHYSFRVNAPKVEEGKPAGKPVWFVSVLTGPENTSDYTYMGIIAHVRFTAGDVHGERPEFRLTGKSTYNPDSKPVRVFQWAMSIMAGDRALPEGWTIQHMGKCCRCGRALTDPESIRLGIGPTCREGG